MVNDWMMMMSCASKMKRVCMCHYNKVKTAVSIIPPPYTRYYVLVKVVVTD